MNDEDLIVLREGETAVLIKESNRDRIMQLTFGPGFVALKWKESRWALPLLAKLRGLEIPPRDRPIQ